MIRALHEDSDVDIVRMANEEQGPLLIVKMNVVYCDSIIGEVIIQYGQEPALMKGAQFLSDLTRTPTPDHFEAQILEHLSELARREKIYRHQYA